MALYSKKLNKTGHHELHMAGLLYRTASDCAGVPHKVATECILHTNVGEMLYSNSYL